MPFVKIESGAVTHKSYQPRAGFIEAPAHVSPGYLYDEATGKFTAPDTSPTVEQQREQLQAQLDSIDARYHSDRSWREYVIAHPDGFAPDAVERMQAAEDEAAPLRDELAAL